jgi:hypothetical protein
MFKLTIGFSGVELKAKPLTDMGLKDDFFKKLAPRIVVIL